MRILQINSSQNWGGGEVHVFLLCNELAHRGYPVTLAARPGSIIINKFRAANLPVLECSLRGAVDFNSAKQLAVYCAQNQINILHAHLARDYWIARMVKIINPDIHLIFTRHLTRPIKADFLHKWLFKEVDKLIVVSEAVKRSLVGQNLLPLNKIAKIYNGIDTERFKNAIPTGLRCTLGIDPQIRLIGIVGEVSPHKGQEILIRSFPLVIAKDPNINLIIIGSDFKEGKYIEDLKVLAQSLGVRDRVFFLGFREDIPNLIKDLDILVLASKNESFGLTIVEGMAAGIPVIVTNTGGVSEIVIDNETGLLVEPNQPVALANAILYLLANPQLAKKLGQAGQKRATDYFSLNLMVEKTIEVYHEVLEEK